MAQPGSNETNQGCDAMSYCQSDFADAYFAKRAFTDAWNTSGSEEVKNIYLETATRMIQDFCSFSDSQDFQSWPESDESYPVPEWLKRATCEQALYLLNLKKDPTQADRKLTLGIRSTDGTVFDKDFQADILCKSCCRILEDNGGMIAPEAIESDSTRTSGGWITK